MTLWAWSVGAWTKPVVKRACLDLKDLADKWLALLLWRAGRAAEGRPTSPDLIQRAANIARPVETWILRPLRAARRSLAEDQPGLDNGTRLGARDQLRAAELDLERALLEALEALPSIPSGKEDADVASALEVLMEIWTASAPGDQARGLAATLARALARAPA
jgi:uncharacterized protein (TIGR02444 family)